MSRKDGQRASVVHCCWQMTGFVAHDTALREEKHYLGVVIDACRNCSTAPKIQMIHYATSSPISQETTSLPGDGAQLLIGCKCFLLLLT